jgi:Raf kinase inhibitor-like YbhB/YbcL family protein
MKREGIFKTCRRASLSALAAAALAAVLTATVEARQAGKEARAMKLTSTAFQDGMPIPVRYTGFDADVSPPLQWSGAPAGTKGFALICDDPDAPVGTWVHWVIYGLPASAGGLPEGVAAAESLPDGARQGVNDFRQIGYRGPLPPPGGPHRYFFRLYALDAELALGPRATKLELLRAMKGHTLAEAQLMGTFQRPR